MKLLLVGATTGYQTRSFADEAARLGHELVLATDRCHVLDDPWSDQAIPLRFEDPTGAAEALAAGPRVDGIVAVGDRPALIAALAAERMGLRYNAPESVRAAGDKFLARERFRAAELNVPAFERVPLTEPPVWTRFPCVLKPIGLSASRGVIRANDPKELAAAFQRIQAILGPDGRYLLIEDFIEGREFALEGILMGGRLRVLSLFDKPDPMDGPFFEETIYVTPSRETAETQRSILEATGRAVRALGLTEGAVHAEMRVNARGVWMLEVAARPIGGLCARVLPGLEELILRHAAGEDVSAFPMSTDAAGVMMIPIPREGIFVDVCGLDDARSIAGIEDVIITAKPGYRLIPLPEGASYLGFIFARGASPGAAERALRESHARLRFEISTTLPVV